jgi:hypothetical protein
MAVLFQMNRTKVLFQTNCPNVLRPTAAANADHIPIQNIERDNSTKFSI